MGSLDSGCAETEIHMQEVYRVCSQDPHVGGKERQEEGVRRGAFQQQKTPKRAACPAVGGISPSVF